MTTIQRHPPRALDYARAPSSTPAPLPVPVYIVRGCLPTHRRSMACYSKRPYVQASQPRTGRLADQPYARVAARANRKSPLSPAQRLGERARDNEKKSRRQRRTPPQPPPRPSQSCAAGGPALRLHGRKLLLPAPQRWRPVSRRAAFRLPPPVQLTPKHAMLGGPGGDRRSRRRGRARKRHRPFSDAANASRVGNSAGPPLQPSLARLMS